jgi:soluble P-type ATPase
LVGNARLLREEGLEPSEASQDPRLATATPVYLAVDGRLEAVLYAADAIRPDSRQLIHELHRRGIQAHMLTGDVAAVAHAVAERVGLAPEEVHAEALPDQKAELVKSLALQGHKVAFVGDGINDSAALAYADVSISFASGSDLARETADIVLTNDKVSGLLVAQDLSRRTFELVKQNIGIVGVPNLTALVVGTFLPISPILAVLLNNGSSLVAAANAMRVLGFRAKELPPANLETVAGPTSVAPTQGSKGGEAVQTKASSGGATGTSVPPTEVVASVVSATDGIADASLEVSLSELSSRLSLKHQTITARRRRADFSTWVRSHDPEGHGWSYCSQTKMYRSVVA